MSLTTHRLNQQSAEQIENKRQVLVVVEVVIDDSLKFRVRSAQFELYKLVFGDRLRKY
jgi:hypothetical protein